MKPQQVQKKAITATQQVPIKEFNTQDLKKVFK